MGQERVKRECKSKQLTESKQIWLLQIKDLKPDADFITEHIPSLLKFTTHITMPRLKKVKISKRIYLFKKKIQLRYLWLKVRYECIIQAERQKDNTGLQIIEYVVKDALRQPKYTKKCISSCIIPIRSHHPRATVLYYSFCDTCVSQAGKRSPIRRILV